MGEAIWEMALRGEAAAALTHLQVSVGRVYGSCWIKHGVVVPYFVRLAHAMAERVHSGSRAIANVVADKL